MGWYTAGPGELQYKSGDVVQLARHCPVGRCSITPRIRALDEDDEFIEDIEFFSDLQQAIEARRLPWQHLDLVQDDMAVPRDVDLTEKQAFFAKLVHEHIDSIRKVIEEEAEASPKSIDISFDFNWEVDAEDVARLLDWLNEPLRDAPELRLTRDNLARGTLDGDWYKLPRELREAGRILSDDDPRHLALCAALAACVANEEISLSQPDDVFELTVWPESDREGDEEGAVETRDSAVYVPAEHPLIAHMATSLGLDQKAQNVSFYFYASFDEVGGPTFPDEGPDPEDVDAYFVLARAVGRALHVYAGGREETPSGCSVGFHLDASCEALASAFEAAGYQPRSLNDYLEASMRSPVDPQSDLVEMCKSFADFPGELACIRYVLEGKQTPPQLTPVALVALLRFTPDPEKLAPDQAKRLFELLETVCTLGGESE